MHKQLQHLLLFEAFNIRTKLSGKDVLRKTASFADPEYTDYDGDVTENGFFIAEKTLKWGSGWCSQNSFAPVAIGKIEERDGMTSISVVLRMRLLVLIIFVPIYLSALLCVVPFPFLYLLLRFAFFKPAKRLREALESLLWER